MRKPKRTPETVTAYRERMVAVLDAACKQRPNLDVEQYEANERAALLAEVNRLRAERGVEPVDVDRLAYLDRQATGHVDWFDKLTVFCAELALDIERRVW